MHDIDILGIDLGTTNSVIALWNAERGQTTVLPNREGERLTPSVVTFDAELGTALVGKSAIAQRISHPRQVIYSVKRFIGSTFEKQSVRDDQKHVTYEIQETQQHRVLIQVGEHTYSPPQISAEVLRKLKHDAEAVLGRPVTQAVITVPAYFNEAQRQATKEAGELAGLYIPRIINEPTAAALAFGLGQDAGTVAVYDLGGGTFDISILRIEHGLFRVKATSGDTHLGGDDFDLEIVQWLREEIKRQHGTDLPVEEHASLQALLRMKAEQAKIVLSSEDHVTLAISHTFIATEEAIDLAVTLSRDVFERRIHTLIERSLAICTDVLKNAGMDAKEIDQVLLVGGQTRTPAVRAAIEQRFGWKVNASMNPDEAVAQGAAILGARLCGYLKEQVKLWDVLPLSLGIELANGNMEPILHANAQIPITVWRKDTFTTGQNGQTTIRFRIFQGEKPIASENTLIGEVQLTLTTSRPKGEPRINCMFKVDADGILHVRAEDADTDSEPVEAMFDHIYRAEQDNHE